MGERKKIPRYIWEKMGEMGFLGLSYPEEYGGANLDFFTKLSLMKRLEE